MWLPRNQYLQFTGFTFERYLHSQTFTKSKLKQTRKYGINPSYDFSISLLNKAHIPFFRWLKEMDFVPTASLKQGIASPALMGFSDISSWIIAQPLGSSPTSSSSNSLSHFVDYCTSSLIKSRVNHDHCAVKHLGRRDMESTKKCSWIWLCCVFSKPFIC